MIFIDANKYLYLYKAVIGKKLLPALQAQKDHIFITQQIVEEVSRNKVRCAADLLATQLQNLGLKQFNVPHHLWGADEGKVADIRRRWQELRKEVDSLRTEFHKRSLETLQRMVQSLDDVSVALKPIFSKAVAATNDEMQRARERKERGIPPGKPNDPLGDEINWEQLLAHLRKTNVGKLWIITEDTDFLCDFVGDIVLNARLYQDIAQTVEKPPEIYYFKELSDGIEHFAATTGIGEGDLPTKAETEEIKKEEVRFGYRPILTVLEAHNLLEKFDSYPYWTQEYIKDLPTWNTTRRLLGSFIQIPSKALLDSINVNLAKLALPSLEDICKNTGNDEYYYRLTKKMAAE